MPPFAYLFVFFAIPFALMAVVSFAKAGEWGGIAPLLQKTETGTALNLSWENYVRLFESSLYLHIFLRSFLYALLCTFFCALLAYPLAIWVAKRKKTKNLALFLVILPFWSNFLIRIYAWMTMLGPESFFMRGLQALSGMPLSLLFTPTAVVLGLVYVNLPFMVLPLYANLEKHDPLLLDAARDLGASSWKGFWRITFPLSLPGLFAGATFVFIPSLGSFAVPELLGGTRTTMIGNFISQQFLASQDWPFGSALSVVLTFFSVVVMLAAQTLFRVKR